jgi:hypothetical protein
VENRAVAYHSDLPELHGPYWQWSAKVKGKTVTRRLSKNGADLYSEWIANDRRLSHLIQQMRQVEVEDRNSVSDSKGLTVRPDDNPMEE